MDMLLFVWIGFMVLLRQVLQATQKYNTGQDKITDLPGAPRITDFVMYSGYLDVTESKKLHYWLNTCLNENSNTLLIWFNGGPGCSSMDGLFMEHGPLKFNSITGNLERNKYSWNKLAHTLYIESPPGVGFSHGPSSEPVSDDTVSRDVLAAIFSFFEKFPSLAGSNIYISGESYAGVYIPTLADAILNSGTPMQHRIKGFIIGNGLMNSKVNDQSLVYFAYYHGLFGSVLWNELLQSCCEHGRPDRCEFYQYRDEECMLQVANVMQIVTNEGLNIYNLYQDCVSPIQSRLMRYFIQSLREKFFQSGKMLHNLEPLMLVPPCANATLITKYLNRPDVQSAIHVTPKEWRICDDDVHNNYQKKYNDMTPFIKRILEQMDSRILLYFGDVDMACNYIGGEWFTDQLGYKLISPRRRWNVEADDGSDQVAGFVKGVNKLTFATIKGAGHMVPADRPKEAFSMIQRFLADQPL